MANRVGIDITTINTTSIIIIIIARLAWMLAGCLNSISNETR